MSDSGWEFSGLFLKEGLTTEASEEERLILQASVVQALTREFEVGTAECVIRPDVLMTLGITGILCPLRFEDVWSRLRAVGRECGLVSTGVYRVRPMEGVTTRRKSRP